LPPEVDAIFFKAVALNPKDRYQSAGDMRQAVSRLLYQMPEEASSKTLSHFVQALFAEEFERRRNQPPVQIPEPQSAMASVGESAPPPVKPASPAGLLDGFPSSGLPLRPLPGDGEEVIDDDFSYLKAGRRAKWMVLLSLIILLVVGGVFFGSDLVRVFSTIGDVIDESAQRLAQKKLGTLLVRSRPTGATVYFGGRMQGSTDMRIKSIDPTREYELVMTLEGFGSWSRKILPADWQQDKERMLIEVFKDFSQQ
jgi:hypothetical protein